MSGEGSIMTRMLPAPVRVAVVGAGEWGINHVRTFAQLREAHLVSVCDLDGSRLQQVRTQYSGVGTTTDFDDVLKDPSVEAVVLASFAAQHFGLCTTTDFDDVLKDPSVEAVVLASFAAQHFGQARAALEAGKHVLVEKPMTLKAAEAEDLVRLARRAGRCLMVGHLLLYHPAVTKMKTLLDSGEVGDLFYLYSQRLNLGRVRKAENALWSFGPHDVAVALHLFGAEPEIVTAKGEAYLQKGIADGVFVTLHFPKKKMAHIHLSWLDPHKTRRTTMVGSRKMIVFDDMEPTDKVRIYDKGVDVRPQSVPYEDYLHVRFGDVLIPHIATGEPLRAECRHFLECVRTGRAPLSDGIHGAKVIRVLAAAQKSLELDGAPVPVKA